MPHFATLTASSVPTLTNKQADWLSVACPVHIPDHHRIGFGTEYMQHTNLDAPYAPGFIWWTRFPAVEPRPSP